MTRLLKSLLCFVRQSVFTALHAWPATRCSHEKAVSFRLSVCPSVCQTRDLWQNRRNICPDFYTVRKII